MNLFGQLGRKESMKDTTRVLGRMFDGIEFRGAAQEAVETLGAYAGVPVWNGLTDDWHPTQMLADMLTMRDHAGKPLAEVRYCYLGDGRNNTANSLGVDAALRHPSVIKHHDLVHLVQASSSWVISRVGRPAVAASRSAVSARRVFRVEVSRPVHAELEFLDDSRDHADRDIDQEERAETLRHPQVDRVLFHQPRRLHAGHQNRQADR